MYNFEEPKHKLNYQPWNSPIKDRIKSLRDAKKGNRKTVAFLYPEFDSSTFRYRGYNVSATLDYSYNWCGTYFEGKEIEDVHNILDVIDILIIIRCAWNYKIEGLIKACKEHNIRIGYDVDDLIFAPKYMHFVIDALGLDEVRDWNFWFGLTERNRMVVDMCDFTITTNGFLAEYLKNDYSKKENYIIKNYLNWIQEDYSKIVLEEKLKHNSEDEFALGYFSGSPTHVRDLELVMPEIEQFMHEHEDVVLRIVGYMELSEQYQYLVDEERIVFIPFQTFTGLQYQQAIVDINIVPLVNNEFSNCKSELKYFESAIVGTVTCATPSYTYLHAIDNGVNGYICEVGEWLPAFEKIYKDRNNKEFQKRLSEIALEEYAGKNQVYHIEDVLDDVYEG